MPQLVPLTISRRGWRQVWRPAGSLDAVQPPPPPSPPPPPAGPSGPFPSPSFQFLRDDDVRNDIVARLIATNAFDQGGVWNNCPEDIGQMTSITAAAAVEPGSGTLSDLWDAQTGGGVEVMSLLKITLYYRHEDPQIRDRRAENLVSYANNALNGKSLAGLTMPALTRFKTWNWANSAAPERQIVCIFGYSYIVEGWEAHDTTE